MKATCFLPNWPISSYKNYNSDQLYDLNTSIQEKIEGRIIELTCVPTKEMQVNISSFYSVYGFTEEEMDCIMDGNQYYYITNIIIGLEELEIWLDANKD